LLKSIDFFQIKKRYLFLPTSDSALYAGDFADPISSISAKV
jgi:hypothetical protein